MNDVCFILSQIKTMQNPRLISILCLLTVSSLIMSANYYSRTNGNWNNKSTWSTSSGGSAASSTSGSGDIVYIERGYTVTATANAACKSLYFSTETSGNLGTHVLNERQILAISGTLTLQNHANSSVFANIFGKGKITTSTLNVGDNTNPTSNSFTHKLTINDSEVNISGNVSTQSERENNNSKISNGIFNINSSNLTVVGSVTTVNEFAVNTSTFTLGNDSPTLISKGDTPFSTSGTDTSNITLNGTGATVDYAGANQPVYNTDYYKLTLSNSGTKTLQIGTKNIIGNFTVDNVNTSVAATALTIGGNVLLTKSYNATWGAHTHTISGDWTCTSWGGSSFTGSTINFTGSNSSKLQKIITRHLIKL